MVSKGEGLGARGAGRSRWSDTARICFGTSPLLFSTVCITCTSMLSTRASPGGSEGGAGGSAGGAVGVGTSGPGAWPGLYMLLLACTYERVVRRHCRHLRRLLQLVRLLCC
ncbi:hypothetical protein FB451DRAFT_1239706 [Mycena latifolia]|nr:hypothetical protein FB451DRAFT_1239706 [Mycena latifolia]